MKDVVITGVGAVTPLGVGADAFTSAGPRARSASATARRRARSFDPLDFFSRKEARRADRFTQFALAAAQEALAEAGWADERALRAGAHRLHPRHRASAASDARDQPRRAARRGPREGRAARGAADDGQRRRGRDRHAPRPARPGVRRRVGLRGRRQRDRRGRRARSRCGDADAVVTGGSEAALTPLARAAFAALDATSTTGDLPPVRRARDGFVMGEGAGVLVLEDAERGPRARRRRSSAIVRGFGHDLATRIHLTAPRADGVGAAAAITAALADAGLAPDDVDYVNAHGTSTPLNDRAETLAIKTALGEHAHRDPGLARRSRRSATCSAPPARSRRSRRC